MKKVKLIGKSLLYAVGIVAATLVVTGIIVYVPPKTLMIITFCVLWLMMYRMLENDRKK